MRFRFTALALTLTLTALGLLAANWHVNHVSATSPGQSAEPPGGIGQVRATDSVPVTVETENPAPETGTPHRADSASDPSRAVNWVEVESADYKEYAANLRALGFPEELVRAIVILDVEALYAPREALLRERAVPQDAPLSRRERLPTEEDWDRIFEWRDLLIEKKAALEGILGIYVPRDIITTPTSRNYDAQRYALDQLPPEKRDVVQLALENEWYHDDMHKHLDRAAYVEAYQRICDETKAVLTEVLTPLEYQRFWGNSTPAGTELARRTIGMEPTDQEFAAMFEVAWEQWLAAGGVHGLWRARPVPHDQIAAADARMEAALQEVLGPDRYLDYQMAITGVGQQLRAMADRYALPRELVGQVFHIEMESDQLSRGIPGLRSDTGLEVRQRLAELQQRAVDLLGPSLWQAWMDGKNQRVQLNP
jgi:hypothetical protein